MTMKIYKFSIMVYTLQRLKLSNFFSSPLSADWVNIWDQVSLELFIVENGIQTWATIV